MKTFSVFLASSIVEFKSDRLRIGDYIRRLNDELFPKGNTLTIRRCMLVTSVVSKAAQN